MADSVLTRVRVLRLLKIIPTDCPASGPGVKVVIPGRSPLFLTECFNSAERARMAQSSGTERSAIERRWRALSGTAPVECKRWSEGRGAVSRALVRRGIRGMRVTAAVRIAFWRVGQIAINRRRSFVDTCLRRRRHGGPQLVCARRRGNPTAA